MMLKLNGLAVECIIGDLPKERSTTQTLRIDAELDVAGQASETDGISDAVDYAALSYAIRDALVAAKCRLIERAAKVALDVCMSYPLVSSAKVYVTKLGAIPGLASATAVAESRRTPSG